MIELEHLMETLITIADEQTTPCECGLYCPFFDDTNEHSYCKNGNCAAGMAIYAKEIITKENKNES